VSAADEAREVEVVARLQAVRLGEEGQPAAERRHLTAMEARTIWAALEPIRAAERQEAAREALLAAAEEVGAAIRDDHPNAGYRDGRDRAVMILRDRADGVTGRSET
jgi:hypothetical protein